MANKFMAGLFGGKKPVEPTSDPKKTQSAQREREMAIQAKINPKGF